MRLRDESNGAGKDVEVLWAVALRSPRGWSLFLFFAIGHWWGAYDASMNGLYNSKFKKTSSYTFCGVKQSNNES